MKFSCLKNVPISTYKIWFILFLNDYDSRNIMCTGQHRNNKVSLWICKSSKITVFISVFSYKFQYCQHFLFSPFTMHVYPVNSATFNNLVCFVPYIIKYLSLKFPVKNIMFFLRYDSSKNSSACMFSIALFSNI